MSNIHISQIWIRQWSLTFMSQLRMLSYRQSCLTHNAVIHTMPSYSQCCLTHNVLLPTILSYPQCCPIRRAGLQTMVPYPQCSLTHNAVLQCSLTRMLQVALTIMAIIFILHFALALGFMVSVPCTAYIMELCIVYVFRHRAVFINVGNINLILRAGLWLSMLTCRVVPVIWHASSSLWWTICLFAALWFSATVFYYTINCLPPLSTITMVSLCNLLMRSCNQRRVVSRLCYVITFSSLVLWMNKEDLTVA